MLLMHKLLMVAIALTIVASVMPPGRDSAQTTRGVAKRPLVSVVDVPAGTEKLAVQWPQYLFHERDSARRRV